MKTKDALMEARKLITDPNKWTQGAFARNAAGEMVPVSNNMAVCFCMAGAIIRADPANRAEHMRHVRSALSPGVSERFHSRKVQKVYDFNDRSTHDEVLDMLDCMIEDCDQ